MKKGVFRKYIRIIHLWLGLISGLVVFIVSITGTIYVFEPEINLALQSGVYKNVEKENRPFISPFSMREKAEAFFPGKITSMYVIVYPEGDRANIIWLRDSTRKYTAIVQNPYSGEVIHSYPYNVNFWAIVLGLHTSLLIPVVGHEIVNICTIIFVVLMISGLILWYPKQKKHLKQRVTIKWGASPKRLNYDLHNVLGFYMSWILILLALTGLFMAYEWMEKGVYWLASGGEQQVKQVRLNSNADNKGTQSNVEEKIVSIISEYNNVDNYLLNFAMDSAGIYQLTVNPRNGYWYNRNDVYAIDQYSGEIIKTDLWADKNNGDKIQAANLNIHIGAILGIPGKIIAFLASLVSASLPITGFLIWRGRRSKKSGRRV